MTVEGDGGSSGDEYEEVDALDDSDDDFAYEEVELEDDVDDLLDGEDEDFEAALRSLHTMGHPAIGANTTMKPEEPPGEVTKRPEVRRDHVPERCSHGPLRDRAPRPDDRPSLSLASVRLDSPTPPPRAYHDGVSAALQPSRSPWNPPRSPSRR